MRMQSPASSGLLPASYSRRRRNRPNESLGVNGSTTVDNSYNYAVSDTYNSYYHNVDQPPPATYEDTGGNINDASNTSHHLGLTSRRSPSRQRLYALATYTDIDNNKSSDDDTSENDENNINYRHNNRTNDAYEQGYEDVLDKPLKLSDFLINDRCYQRYLSEGKRGSYRGIGPGKNSSNSSSSIMDPTFLAKVCAGASFVGMLFLIFVAILMETQPLYIRGVSIKVDANNNDDGTYRFRKETSNALKAAAAYFLTMVFSLIYLQAREMNLELRNPVIGRICHLRRLIISTYFRYRRRHYDDIPDGTSSLLFGGNSTSSSTSGSILPLHGSSNGGDKLLKSRRRKKRSSKRKSQDIHDTSSDGGAIEGVLGKIKSWGIGGGSSKSGRKKDR